MTSRGGDASPAEYRAAQPERFALIHFTAHAEPNAVSPLDSAVVLSGPPGKFKLYARDVADHPLHADLVADFRLPQRRRPRLFWRGAGRFLVSVFAGGRPQRDRRSVGRGRSIHRQSDGHAITARLTAGAPVADALRAAKLALIHRGGAVAKPYYCGTFRDFARFRRRRVGPSSLAAPPRDARPRGGSRSA